MSSLLIPLAVTPLQFIHPLAHIGLALNFIEMMLMQNSKGPDSMLLQIKLWIC